MSKDGFSVKASPGCKHKERKPKKPHYIPRPWGKPYNYKCFQCPFTCMEKSHLYNHMKYSLCKNSLSLLIESDWPYKKGGAPRPPPSPHHHSLGLVLPPRGVAGQDDPPEEQRRGRGGGGEEKEDEEEEGEEKGSTEGSEGGSSSSSSGQARAHPSAAPLGKHRPPALAPKPERSPEEQLKRCSLPGPLLAEQWRLLAKRGAEGSLPRYPPPPPPPPAPPDYQDPSTLGLSLLGVGYPLGPLGPLGPAGLFSYMGSTAAQLGPTPLLLPPPDRARAGPPTTAPRLYYPFLCEHALGGGVAKATDSIVTVGEEEELAKLGLWKVPALRPPRPPAAEGPNRLQGGWGLKRKAGGAAPGPREGPTEKRPAAAMATGFTLDLLTSLQNVSPLAMATEKMLLHASVPAPPRPSSSPPLEAPMGALLGQLSRALQEYRQAERRAARLGGGAGAPGCLWERLGRIRSELSHLQGALEHAAPPRDGPLDLSVKRGEGPGDAAVTRGDPRETVEEVEEEEEIEEETEAEDEEERERKALKASLESRKQSLDLLIRMSQVGGTPCGGEGAVLLPGPPGPPEPPWPGRTTKCEADSSVLLGPDGRPAVFSDLAPPPPRAKTPKRPPSVQRAPSPLGPAD